ncbi:MAG: hypothetical protein KGJ66_05610 [Alphaproteobacteria bacterium]|nr:hypothetical protein [Alphaproteobacteria bacterium]
MTERHAIEDHTQNTFSLSRETLVSPGVFEKERRAILDGEELGALGAISSFSSIFRA